MSFEQPALVTLACGCKIKMRAKPMNQTSKFMCRSGQGHSYNQPWMSYEDNGRNFQNPALDLAAA